MGRKIFQRCFAAVLTAALATTALATGAWAKELIPVGRAVGIEMTTDGMLVASLSKVGGGEERSPAGEAGIQPGDIIVGLGGSRISCAEDFIAASEKLADADVSVTLRRGEKLIQFTVRPVRAADGSYKLGLWLRDGAAGIGTVTFYDPETGVYGALGHAINDVDTGVRLPVSRGVITQATVTGVRKGGAGSPGELQGAFDSSGSLGGISTNTLCGIFGLSPEGFSGQAMEAAEDGQIKTGPATILATVEGSEPREFAVLISKAYRAGEEKLMVTVTDEALLERTGGIVQGMSGCPIIQDGRLIGAVTHVLLSDPSRGYGIPIGEMLGAAEAVRADAAEKNAA